MGRRQAREFAMQCLYQMDMLEQYDVPAIQPYLNENVSNKKDQEFTLSQVNVFLAHRDQVDEAIKPYLKDWSLDRIAKIDLAILRLAVTEMLYIEDIPTGVSANEAVELAKKFSDDNASSFVNGVLGKFIRENKADK